MKIQISFVCKKIKFVFNENTNQFYVLKKSYLYLMKIQISFENRKNSDLYLMKIQISFEFKKCSMIISRF